MSSFSQEEVFKNECRKYIMAGKFDEQLIAERAAIWIATMLSDEYLPNKNVLGEANLTACGVPLLDEAKIVRHYQSIEIFHKKMTNEIIKMVSYFLSQNANNVINYLALERHLLVGSIEEHRQYELVKQVIHELAFGISPMVIEFLGPLISGCDPSKETVQSN